MGRRAESTLNAATGYPVSTVCSVAHGLPRAGVAPALSKGVRRKSVSVKLDGSTCKVWLGSVHGEGLAQGPANEKRSAVSATRTPVPIRSIVHYSVTTTDNLGWTAILATEIALGKCASDSQSCCIGFEFTVRTQESMHVLRARAFVIRRNA